MSTTFIVLCVFAFVGMLCVIIYYAHKVDQLTTDNGILKHRNETLEERFSQEEQATIAPAQRMTGVETLQTFAQAHQVQLEEATDFEDDDWELYRFTYQDGYFHSFVSKTSDEILIRYAHFYDLPYSNEAYIRILRLCDDFTSNRRYVKLTYSAETNDMGEQSIHLHLYYEMIGLSQAGLEYLLSYNFTFAREAAEAVDAISKELAELHHADNDTPKTEADYQAMAIRMAMERKQQ